MWQKAISAVSGGGGDLVFTDLGSINLATYTVPSDHKGIMIILYRATDDPVLQFNGATISPMVSKTIYTGARVWVYEVNNIKAGDTFYSIWFTEVVYAGFIDD